MAVKYEIDMTNGSLVKNILRFSMPLLITNVLQLLYNAADVVVVGRFVGTNALAAVGATGSLINLLINLFVGMSVGVAVLVSRYYGANEYKKLYSVVQTSFMVSIILGISAMIIGVASAKKLLGLISTPPEVMPDAVKYILIYFIGVPGSLVFNFCAAVLRAVGDTKRPLYILTFTGLLNVVLNVILVVGTGFGVEGVAIATTVANYASAALVVFTLCKTDASYKLNIRDCKINKKDLKDIIVIGLPAGLNGTVFSLSNTVIQSAINSFGANVVAGCTAASNIEGIVWSGMNSVHHGALTAASQNYGAKNKKRIYKTLYVSMLLVVIVGLVMGFAAILFKKPLISLYTNDAEVLKYGETRLVFVCTFYAFCGIMDVLVGFLRGIGFSLTPTIVSMVGTCGFRILWVSTFFKKLNSLTGLMASWPISWILVIIIDAIIILTAGRKRINKLIKEE